MSKKIFRGFRKYWFIYYRTIFDYKIGLKQHYLTPRANPTPLISSHSGHREKKQKNKIIKFLKRTNFIQFFFNDNCTKMPQEGAFFIQLISNFMAKFVICNINVRNEMLKNGSISQERNMLYKYIKATHQKPQKSSGYRSCGHF